MSELKSQVRPEKRRAFLTKLSLGLGGLAAAAASVPVIAALLNPWLREKKRVWRSVGRVDEFEREGGFKLVKYKDAAPDPWAGSTGNSAAWLRRDSDTEFTAFSINCTHLGCPVRWVPSSELFMCPCHGGVFYKDGSVATGPPPKSMVKYPVRVRNGQVEIETTAIPVTTSVRV
ncbi:QcrA and Rieske domain-containing protein [Salmonirosea aquatica]|uniref:Rieske 2Fe-2S domain-containing protein n=1 Tax=Salmonirosea aquatica TaxID=2654236 RepID=A0A7C9BIY5_9BACT|nr:Rieske 2Fe-2S domain-containing protein [Cytophagaceae bacterium SJW1-29]